MKRVLFFLLSLALLAGCSREETPHGRSRPDLIVIFSIDTLRADHVGAYGYEKATTPRIDAFASDGILFGSAWSQVPLTLPSHVSMLTGRSPANTGVRDNLGFRVDPGIPSIPSTLSAEGYRSAGFVSSWVLRGSTGLGDMFDSWDDQITGVTSDAVGELARPGSETVRRAIEWLNGTSGPRFLFVHVFEPHAPYDPPAEFAGGPSAYDGEVTTADHLFGELVDALKSAGTYDASLIVLMSDHGEGLGDHGEKEHGIFLYREALHVPLIVKLPAKTHAGTRIAEPVALLDLFPTIREIAGIDPAGSDSDGVSLLSTLDGNEPEREILSETMYPRIHLGWSDLVSVVEGEHHLIDAPSVELYDMAADPGETNNIATDERRIVARLRDVAAGYDRTIEAMCAVDPAEAEKLSSLGYLSGGSAKQGPLPDPKERIGDLEDFQRAHELLMQGKAGESLELLDGLLQRNPSFADAWILKGRVEERAGRDEDAVRSYRTAVEAAPNLVAGTALSISRVLTRLGRFDEAAQHAALAEKQHPSAARIARARARLGAGDLAAAQKELANFRAGDEMFAEAMLVRSQIEIARRQPARALELLDAAASEMKEPLEGLQMLRADALARLGRIPESKQAFAAEIATFPHDREAYLRLLAIHVLEGHPEEAERTASSLERANPGSAKDIAEAYRKLGRPDLASRWSARGN